jgi:hypothetical protein
VVMAADRIAGLILVGIRVLSICSGSHLYLLFHLFLASAGGAYHGFGSARRSALVAVVAYKAST